jgi:hypothetical protein
VDEESSFRGSQRTALHGGVHTCKVTRKRVLHREVELIPLSGRKSKDQRKPSGCAIIRQLSLQKLE